MDNGLESRLIAPEAETKGDLKGRIWEENKKIWRIAFPSILFRVTSFGAIVVTQSFIGHISSLDLAVFALVQTITVRVANGILLGMSSATETLCGQAFGAKQYHMMGIYLQRSWLIDFATATILLPLFIFATPLYQLLGEEDVISEAADSISWWFIPVVYSYVFSMTIQMYLQAQQRNKIIGWISASSFVLHVLLSWILVDKLNWGLPGAMSALVISSWSLIVGELIYIFGGWCPATWIGFTMAAFVDLWPLIKLSVSSGLMLCLQLWYSSVLVLLAGYADDATVAISAFSICLNISAWTLMVFLGFLGASSVRVSNELGRGNAKAATFSVKVISCISLALGLLFCILCLAFGNSIPYLFTSDEEVAEAASELSVLLAFTLLLNSVQPVLSGVAVGCGSQAKVAIINICSYYVVGVPIGVLLDYVADLGVKGIWIGMLCGMFVQAVVLCYVTWTADWESEINKASERLGRFFMEPTQDLGENSSQA